MKPFPERGAGRKDCNCPQTNRNNGGDSQCPSKGFLWGEGCGHHSAPPIMKSHKGSLAGVNGRSLEVAVQLLQPISIFEISHGNGGDRR